VDLVAEALKRASRPARSVCWYAGLDPEVRAQIDPVMALPLDAVTHGVVQDVINDGLGLSISKNQVEHHRRRLCNCSKVFDL
jgi:hypothetical protein